MAKKIAREVTPLSRYLVAACRRDRNAQFAIYLCDWRRSARRRAVGRMMEKKTTASALALPVAVFAWAMA